jgi:hypothetical protein
MEQKELLSANKANINLYTAASASPQTYVADEYEPRYNSNPPPQTFDADEYANDHHFVAQAHSSLPTPLPTRPTGVATPAIVTSGNDRPRPNQNLLNTVVSMGDIGDSFHSPTPIQDYRRANLAIPNQELGKTVVAMQD